MAGRKSDLIWAAEEMVNPLRSRIVRDKKVRKTLKSKHPDEPYFASFAEATRALANDDTVYEKIFGRKRR